MLRVCAGVELRRCDEALRAGWRDGCSLLWLLSGWDVLCHSCVRLLGLVLIILRFDSAMQQRSALSLPLQLTACDLAHLCIRMQRRWRMLHLRTGGHATSAVGLCGCDELRLSFVELC